MADLLEKQWDLDGVLFGLNAPVELKNEGWVPNTAEIRAGDVDHPDGDGIRLGTDYHGSSTWAFSLFTNGTTEEEAWAHTAALRNVWADPTKRLEPEVAVPLRYRLAGVTRRVYGRPRRFTPTPNNLSLSGRIDIECDFLIAYPLFFGDVENTKTIGIGAPLELDAGIAVPFVPPFVSDPGTTESESDITIGGEAATPVIVKITGPVNNAIVRIGNEAVIALKDQVEIGNPVTADPRPWVRSITTQAGGSVRVSPRETRLARFWLPPGNHQVTFTGEDITSTASVMINWRDAYNSPR